MSLPFRLRWKRLKKPSPRRIYRFRRAVKRLRAYLSVYTFPASPPDLPALSELYKAAGKLRQAYLIRKQVKKWLPQQKKAAKERVRRRIRQFHRAYAAQIEAAKAELRAVARQFPSPPKAEKETFWKGQVNHWLSTLKETLRAFPNPPYSPPQWHELRKHLRTWEMAAEVQDLPELPPTGLTKALGQARDLHLLLQWLEKRGAPSSDLTPIRESMQAWENQALEQWVGWRSSL